MNEPISRSRRNLLLGASTLLLTGLPSLRSFANSSNNITVDLHTHAFLDDSEMDLFSSGNAPDITFVAGHSRFGDLDEVFSILSQYEVPLIKNVNDIFAAKSAGKRAALVTSEGAYAISGSIEKLRELHSKGLACLQPVRNESNEMVEDDELTSFGKEVIKEQNKLGMIVDMAHAQSSAIHAALDASSKPVMLSHMNMRVSDTWKDVAESGGVIGGWWGPKEVRRKGFGFDDWIDRISEIVDEVGIDHVGVQTELGTPMHRGPFDSHSDWSSIGDALKDKGYSADEVSKILGGNFIRMYKEISVG